MDIKVIGAGLGGLAVSCLLANDGHNVTVFEQNRAPGGKMNQLLDQGYHFDTGPSLLTMPFVLDAFFEKCGARMSDYLVLTSPNPICRYVYADGTRFDCWKQRERNLDQIDRFASRDKKAFQHFLDYASTLYNRTKDAFLFNPLYNISDLQSLNLVDILRIDAFSTMSDKIDRQFDSTYLRQFFKRFATYSGSSPYQAPATLNVIPHVELTLGGYYIEGGMYGLPTALARLAKKMGVKFCYNASVTQINTTHGKACGIILDDQTTCSADLVFSNSDALGTYLNLLDDSAISNRKQRRIQALEPSCSGFVLMLGIDRKYEQLLHHTIFFSADYELEFDQIFQEKIMPSDPTIYVANTSFSNNRHAPRGGSNLFILVNAPYLSDAWNWKKEKKQYAALIIDKLERKGLKDLRHHIKVSHYLTPEDFYRKYSSNRGSIYGTSSNNKMATFLRPRNKSSVINGLYLIGGSTHPGGGIPLVILSALHGYHLAKRYDLK